MTARRVKYLRRMALTVTILIAALAPLYVFALPAYVRYAIGAALTSRGLDHASFALDSVSYHTLTLSDIRLDATDRTRIGRVEVTYTPGTLWQGRVKTVRLTDMNWRVNFVDGRFDLGPLAQLKTGDEPMTDWPFDVMQFQRASIALAHAGATWSVPLETTLTRGGDGTMNVAATIQLLDKPMSLTGSAALGDAGPTAALAVQPVQIQLEQDSPPHRFMAQMTGGNVTAAIAVEGRLAYGAGRLAGPLTIGIDRGRIEFGQAQRNFSGVSAAVRLDSLWPVATGEGQTLAFHDGRIGEFSVRDGSAQFAVTSLHAIDVQRVQWRSSDAARFWIEPFAVDPTGGALDLVLRFQDADLSDLLWLVTAKKITGRGRIGGRLPLRLRFRPRLHLALGEGFIRSQGDGDFQISSADLIERTLGESQASGQPATTEQETNYGRIVNERIVQSLQDFHYDELAFNFIDEEGKMLARVHTQGQGRKVPQVLDLTVNLRGLEQLVNPALRIKLGLGDAMDRAVNEALQ